MSNARQPVGTMSHYRVEVKIHHANVVDNAQGWTGNILASSHANAIAMALIGSNMIDIQSFRSPTLSPDVTLTVSCTLSQRPH